MRAHRFIGIVSLVLAACGDSAVIAVDCADPHFQKERKRLEASVGARYADKYFTIFRRPKSECELQTRRVEYIDSFFYGFKASATIQPDDKDPIQHLIGSAMRAGGDHRRAYPNEVDATFASYGYVAVDAEGKWTSGFEVSQFEPASGYEGESWWLGELPDMQGPRPGSNGATTTVRIRVKGYVTDKGQYGHLSAYDRDLLVRELDVLMPNNSLRSSPSSVD